MTWTEFCGHADQIDAGAHGYQVRPFESQRSHYIEDAYDRKRQRPADEWLRHQNIPKVRADRAEPGYYGRTRGEIFVGESDGFYVLMLEQTLIDSYGATDTSCDANIVSMRKRGWGVPKIAEALEVTRHFVRVRFKALGLNAMPTRAAIHDPQIRFLTEHCTIVAEISRILGISPLSVNTRLAAMGLEPYRRRSVK